LAFFDDPHRFIEKVNILCDELEERIAKGEGVALVIDQCSILIALYSRSNIAQNIEQNYIKNALRRSLSLCIIYLN